MASLVLKALAVFFATFSIPLIVNAQYEGDIYVPGRYRLTITQTPPDTSLTLVAGANKTYGNMGFIGLRYGNCSSENINQEDMESGETLCHIPSDNKPHPLQLSFLPPRGISDMGASIKAQVEEGELNEIWSDFVRIDIDESKWECQFVIPIAVDGLQGKKVPFTINLADSTGRGVLYVEATFRVF